MFVIMLGTCIMLIGSINIGSSNMFLSFIASNFVTESIISVYVIVNQFLGSCLMRQMVDLHSKSKYCGLYYRPPTKLREVNVFIRVSLSTGSPMRLFPMMHLTLLYRTHPQSQSCPSRHGISGPPPQTWDLRPPPAPALVAITGGLFKLLHFRTP